MSPKCPRRRYLNLAYLHIIRSLDYQISISGETAFSRVRAIPWLLLCRYFRRIKRLNDDSKSRNWPSSFKAACSSERAQLLSCRLPNGKKPCALAASAQLHAHHEPIQRVGRKKTQILQKSQEVAIDSVGRGQKHRLLVGIHHEFL